MELHAWPGDFVAQRRGERCAICEEGRVDERADGIRYFSGAASDAYLQRTGPTPGYSVVIFRSRHVAGPEEMTSDEHAAFWTDVANVARAIMQAYRPVHINYQLLGNVDPHVHVHIVPRFDPDPAPSMPLPDIAWQESTELTSDEAVRQVARLKSALSERIAP